MYQIDRIRLIPPIANETEQIRKAVAKRIRVDAKTLTDVTIVKRSLDARKKPELKYSYTVAFDLPDKKTAQKLLKKDAKGQSEIRLYEPKDYPLPEAVICLNSESVRPIVVGSGPAGLFCAYVLAKAGMRPKILERGKSVEERTKT
ncbi:MAG: NAD(P)-binding protein, partial [Lachnospiraceae bacterium]|nr:NAD(P)-binding protein [Lachnospiraceae bacterium]